MADREEEVYGLEVDYEHSSKMPPTVEADVAVLVLVVA